MELPYFAVQLFLLKKIVILLVFVLVLKCVLSNATNTLLNHHITILIVHDWVFFAIISFLYIIYLHMQSNWSVKYISYFVAIKVSILR
jgi:hypothetical protein